MKKRLFAFICSLILFSSCHQKDSVFKKYEVCTVMSEQVICTDFRLPKESPKYCKFLTPEKGHYICDKRHIYGYNATSGRDATSMRLIALKLEKDLRRANRDLLLCRGI